MAAATPKIRLVVLIILRRAILSWCLILSEIAQLTEMFVGDHDVSFDMMVNSVVIVYEDL